MLKNNALKDSNQSAIIKMLLATRRRLALTIENTVMAIRPAPPVFLEPEETIALWSIREFEFSFSNEKSRHLIGIVPSKMKFRVTSPLDSFDYNTLQIKTQSGRTYHLISSPTINVDIEYHLKIWMRLHGVISELDVTHEYIRSH